MNSLFWRVATVLLIGALFYIGMGLRGESPEILPSLASRAFANVGVATENVETIITASSDGRTIYVWRYFGVKPPKYLGKGEAILDR